MGKKNKAVGVVYSTNPDFRYTYEDEEELVETLPPHKQKLNVNIEKKNRGGKVVTVVKGFVGTDDDLDTLAKKLKTKCGVGGAGKDGIIIIQGDCVAKVKEILAAEGYRC